MKKLLLLLLVSNSVWANPFEIKKPVICDKTEIVLKTLSSSDYQEKPIWLGAADEKLVNYSLWVNSSTKSWTIVQFNNDISCVIGTGESYTIIGKKPNT
jgi:hypothetical protein